MFDFSKVVDRHGTWCTQWDYVADRFGSADLLPFTISDMDFATAPCILEALTQRLSHGVLGYSRWKNDEFLAAIQHWFLTRHNTKIDPQSLVYGPSVIYMVSELIRQWSSAGDAVVIHTPAYDAFYKAIEGNQRVVRAVELEKRTDGWYCDMAALESALSRPESKILLLCSPQNPTGKVWTRDELETMAELCQRHGVKVISDEIHMDMVWGDHPHIPWSNVARDSWALLTSGSKSFNIPALTGAYGMIEDAQSRNDYLSALKGRDGLSSPAVLALTAHIAAYQQGASWLDALRDYLASNLHYVSRELNAAFPELSWQVPQSTYLAWIDLRPLNIDDRELQEALIHQQKVAIMPGYTYGKEGRGFVRLNAGCPRSKLEKGVQGLINAIRTIR
ncbi:pyridoxal phosphate-dependent aminotransferase [Citrobacter cronae]|uniref:MalY/PatB family protein n=1 Tax=Citrobacter TaxID=544 RepID=UPI0010C9B346|nr:MULTISPECIES: MalY/PatB family protein [Citrobacter]MCU6183186.1 pyridoxal phosphate-dependent aminotransferase [Citrobacter cronae]MCU6198262.1 pyridoxal phosphate-dependent aminotransferase [Citrobacter cronae]MEB5755292.1 pyridoxal phosphate-dependent aminotransferase [Citrobacter cronae]TKU31966.1 pyridoxal phosphate-dependent aminotransferase [Citrobacter sp. wls717]TKU86390.1 pyridoxal phosphate-dependent aminotransferase [Citrobacter sp. wls707]